MSSNSTGAGVPRGDDIATKINSMKLSYLPKLGILLGKIQEKLDQLRDDYVLQPQGKASYLQQCNTVITRLQSALLISETEYGRYYMNQLLALEQQILNFIDSPELSAALTQKLQVVLSPPTPMTGSQCVPCAMHRTENSSADIAVYRNTGCHPAPFQNSGSYAGSAGYSSIYCSTGDYQTCGGLASSDNGSQTTIGNSWNAGGYAKAHQYSGCPPADSSSAESSSSIAPTADYYSQHYKQLWADYNSQTLSHVTCAPGTETSTSASTYDTQSTSWHMLNQPPTPSIIPVLGGYPNSDNTPPPPPPPGTTLWNLDPSSWGSALWRSEPAPSNSTSWKPDPSSTSWRPEPTPSSTDSWRPEPTSTSTMSWGEELTISGLLTAQEIEGQANLQPAEVIEENVVEGLGAEPGNGEAIGNDGPAGGVGDADDGNVEDGILNDEDVILDLENNVNAAEDGILNDEDVILDVEDNVNAAEDGNGNAEDGVEEGFPPVAFIREMAGEECSRCEKEAQVALLSIFLVPHERYVLTCLRCSKSWTRDM